jgi:hypothetical protein
MPAKKRGSRPRPMARPAADRGPPVSPHRPRAREDTEIGSRAATLPWTLPDPVSEFVGCVAEFAPEKSESGEMRDSREPVARRREWSDESGQRRERVVRQNMSQVCHII